METSVQVHSLRRDEAEREFLAHEWHDRKMVSVGNTLSELVVTYPPLSRGQENNENANN